MSKENNLTDFLMDVADAIREKKGTAEKINPQNFSDEIKGIKTSMWTGHVDVEGLKAIGWDDEDIAYYQEHGVNWMEEDDEYHLVPEENKALYGILTVDNLQEYKDKIIYLPKIDTSGLTTMSNMFNGWNKLVAVPMLNLKNVIDFNNAFINCWSLTSVPEFDVKEILLFACFSRCYSLTYMPLISKASGANSFQTFAYCYSLKQCGYMENLRVSNNTFLNAYSIEDLRIDGLAKSISVRP